MGKAGWKRGRGFQEHVSFCPGSLFCVYLSALSMWCHFTSVKKGGIPGLKLLSKRSCFGLFGACVRSFLERDQDGQRIQSVKSHFQHTGKDRKLQKLKRKLKPMRGVFRDSKFAKALHTGTKQCALCSVMMDGIVTARRGWAQDAQEHRSHMVAHTCL